MSIIRKDYLAWFELGTSQNPLGLVLRIHKSEIPEMNEHLRKGSGLLINSGDPEGLQLGDFADFSTDQPWGFGQVVQPLGLVDLFYCWRIEIPEIATDHTNEDGRIDYSVLDDISYTLNLLQIVLSFYGDHPLAQDSPRHQLITYRLSSSKGLHGGSLTVELSRELVGWLRSLNPQTADGVAQQLRHTMKDVYSKLDRRGDGENMIVRLQLKVDLITESGRIHFSCPGNACGLDPVHSFLTSDTTLDRGYELVPHNVDNFVQQVTLLMGVARLCDLFIANN